MATEKSYFPVPEEHVGEAEDVMNVSESGGRTAVAEAPADPATAEEESASVKHEGPDGADENETVNFTDEDAALDAAQPEHDMGEATDEERAQEEHADAETARNLEDISRLAKHRLVELFASLLQSKPVQQIWREAEAIKAAFYKLHRAENEQKRREFTEGGGAPEDFVPQPDADEARLKELFAEYRRRRAEYLANIEKEKEENLRTKLQIIEELKELVNGNETMNSTFNPFHEHQPR